MSLKVVQTKYGAVEGIRSGIPTVISFRGIPFAAPPVGPLRWREPQPPLPWEGIRKCFEYQPVCMQEKRDPNSFAAKEFYAYQPPCSEDSLYLNLWTPAQSADERLPVMVYLYGGANIQGYNCKMEADGDLLAKRGVIYVCAAYRLGVFGFLAHPELSSESGHGSGNYGLLDQLAALRWVKENIAAFGGDPEIVTVFGQSAGGADLQVLLCSPQSTGLFHRGICQSSGGLLCVVPAEPLAKAEERGVYFQRIARCRNLQEMRSLSADQIMQIIASEPASSPVAHGQLPVCIDGYVLKKPLAEAFSRGECMNIPLIVGCTSDEGKGGFPLPSRQNALPALGDKIAESYQAYAQKAASLYHTDDPDEALRLFPRVWGDSMLLGSRLLARAWERNGGSCFVYLFNRQLPDADGISRHGAFHSADLWYTFGNFYRSWRPMSGVDYELASAMNQYWTNFAKLGDPNGPGLPAWPVFTKENPITMVLGEKIYPSLLSDHPVVRQFDLDLP